MTHGTWVIAGETVSGGGLDHYLACLEAALRRAAPAKNLLLRRAEASRTSDTGFRIVESSVRRLVGDGRLRRLLRRSLRGLVARRAFPRAAAWAAEWRALPHDAVALLPHVVCNDHGALDDYYDALLQRPLVWVVHDLHPLHFPEQWEAPMVELFEWRCRALAAHAGAILVHNAFTRRDVIERLAPDPQKLHVVGLPSILPPCPPLSTEESAASVERLGLQKPYALWSSSSTFAHKNHVRLFRALRQLLDCGVSLRLVCTGNREPNWELLARRIAALGLQAHVTFTGNLPHTSLCAVLQHAELAVCPTLFEGGGSGPAAEALVHGIPVACSDIPQLREQFESVDAALAWFDPNDERAIADAIERILADPSAARERTRAAAVAYPKLRSWERVAEVYWGAFDAVARR